MKNSIPVTYSNATEITQTAFETHGINVWVIEGNREICITFFYNQSSGFLEYAACIYRKSNKEYELTDTDIDNTQHTTNRRFAMRPVFIWIPPNLALNQILKMIRYEMCFGHGCKGYRYKTSSGSYASSESSNDYLSETSESYTVKPFIHTIKETKMSRWQGVCEDGEYREVFITFKGDPKTGELIYGASIHHNSEYISHKVINTEQVDDSFYIEDHYSTAFSRLDKCPVHLKIPIQYAWQLNNESNGFCPHKDINNLIWNNIFDRVNGEMQIKGPRLMTV